MATSHSSDAATLGHSAKPTTLQLDIVSAEAMLYRGRVKYVTVTGSVGELGIHPGHTALLTSLKPGEVIAVNEKGQRDVYYISGGFLEVQPDVVTVLADTAVRAADLDEAAAQAAKAHAEKKLSEQKAGLEYSKALTELAQATAQLRAIKKISKLRH